MSWHDDPVSRALACHMCGGLGYVEVQTRGAFRERCPMCAAPMRGTTAYDVRWDASEKRFQVALEFPLPDNPIAAAQLVRDLPGLIAQDSRCSCGSSLAPGDHDVSVQGPRASFRGTFRCPRCRDSGSNALSKVRTSIASIWRQIVRVKVGPTGLEFERSPEKLK
jgi:hypothetical protein